LSTSGFSAGRRDDASKQQSGGSYIDGIFGAGSYQALAVWFLHFSPNCGLRNRHVVGSTSIPIAQTHSHLDPWRNRGPFQSDNPYLHATFAMALV